MDKRELKRSAALHSQNLFECYKKKKKQLVNNSFQPEQPTNHPSQPEQSMNDLPQPKQLTNDPSQPEQPTNHPSQPEQLTNDPSQPEQLNNPIPSASNHGKQSVDPTPISGIVEPFQPNSNFEFHHRSFGKNAKKL